MPIHSDVAQYRVAGGKLATALGHYDGSDVVVLALVPGGVFVAVQIVESLHAQLDVVIVHELSLYHGLAIGVLAEGCAPEVDRSLVARLHLSPREVAAVIVSEMERVTHDIRAFRGKRPFPSIAGRTVILVDDGTARVHTLHTALKLVRLRDAARLVLALPSAANCTLLALLQDVDEIAVLDESTGSHELRAINEDDVVAELYRGRLATTIRAIPAGNTGVISKAC